MALAGLGAIVPPASWINHPSSAHTIEGNRLLQLRIAEANGYAIPDSIISNDPTAIADFAARYEQVAVKSLGGYWTEDTDGARVAFTHVTTADALASVPHQLSSAPVMVQPYIKKRCEWRVTVIDSTTFFTRIDSQDTPAAVLDWRKADLTHVKHTLTEPSPEQHDQAVQTVATAGLRYAAIDLIETPDGQIYFLDLNPSGQYGWIEQLTGAPITNLLATALLNSYASPDADVKPRRSPGTTPEGHAYDRRTE